MWTVIALPSYLAEQYQTTEAIIYEGELAEVGRHISENHIPLQHDSAYTHGFESYAEALTFAFGEERPSTAIGQSETVLDVNPNQLTVSLEADR